MAHWAKTCRLLEEESSRPREQPVRRPGWEHACQVEFRGLLLGQLFSYPAILNKICWEEHLVVLVNQGKVSACVQNKDSEFHPPTPNSMCQTLLYILEAWRWRQRAGFQWCCLGGKDQGSGRGVWEARGDDELEVAVWHLGGIHLQADMWSYRREGKGWGYIYGGQPDIDNNHKNTRWYNHPGMMQTGFGWNLGEVSTLGWRWGLEILCQFVHTVQVISHTSTTL